MSKVKATSFAELRSFALTETDHPHWSFHYEGIPVTHETDEVYLFGPQALPVRKDSEEVIWWEKEDGSDAKYTVDGSYRLTVEEALERGYTHYGVDGDGWQTLRDLKDWDEDDDRIHAENRTYVLVEKETRHADLTSNEELQQWLAEMFENSHYDNTGDDRGDVHDAIKELDFTATAAMINEALKGVTYRKFTEIEVYQEIK